MKTTLEFDGRKIGPGQPVFIVAELSANHRQDFDTARRTLDAMRAAGADAVKLQTYTADTLTLNCERPEFRIRGGLWEGKSLHELYSEGYMPWEWQPRLQKHAREIGLHFFSTPFDPSAVVFLEEMCVPAYKVASFELVDHDLLRCIAHTGKPIILSCGMATLAEIAEAVRVVEAAGCTELALLKCTSAYPAQPSDANLRTIPHLAVAYGLPVGLSDHTMGSAVSVAAVAMGATIVEKHFILTRASGGLDRDFSLEPAEFKQLVVDIRKVEEALGGIQRLPSRNECSSLVFRRSLFAVRDIAAGECFTAENIRSIRPGMGLAPKHLPEILGLQAVTDIARGTPLSWELILGNNGRSLNKVNRKEES